MKTTVEQEHVFIVDTTDREYLSYGDVLNLYANREKSMDITSTPNDPLVSIYFQAYNHLEEYTKPAIEAIFKYTQDIDYELILVDNGSTDGTFEYFKSLAYPNKRIYRITQNIGAFYGYMGAKRATRGRFIRGKYFVSVPNDVLVTENWLKNMLRCAESDERIGFLVPMSDHVSNMQDVDLGYTDLADMQRKAAIFNQSDPLKWDDRLRLIPTVCMIRTSLREFYEADYGFVYNFADDDLSFAYRRLGYRLILCGDVFVHHEGSTVVGSNRDNFIEDMEKGRAIFRHKYRGIDAWDDVVNFERQLLGAMFETVEKRPDQIHVLGVDVRCGTPLFEIKNLLRRHGLLDVHLAAYTTDAKYWQDLSFVCDGDVYCGDIDRLHKKLGDAMYDYIIIGEYPDTYDDADMLIQDAAAHLREGGLLAFKSRDYVIGDDLQEIADILGSEMRPIQKGVSHLLSVLRKYPYKMDIYPYILDNTIEMQEMLFTQLEAIEAYHQDERIRALYSSERFCTLMMQYVVVLRK